MTLYEDIERIAGTSTNRASYFQLNFFVLGKEPTIQAKLNKCADELKSRKLSLDAAKLELEETQDQIELFKCDLQFTIGSGIDGDVEVLAIRKRQINRKILHATKQMEAIHQRVKAVEEECLFFVEAHKSLSKIEKPLLWDDDEVQLAYWGEKYAKEIKERLMMRMPIDAEIIRSVLCLPDTAPIKKDVIRLAQDKKPELANQA